MLNYNFKKKYGQNFLIDNNIVDKIISYASVNSNDLIIEIGAGSGNLTKKLQNLNSNIIAYEIDPEAKKYLEELHNKKTKIIFDDFLKRDIKKDIQEISYNNLYIIANLPYYITTPIIEKIIKDQLKPQKMLLMVQKEVAERLAAKPKTKDYGFITVYLNYYFNIKKIFNVSKNAFNPIPNVESAVLEFTSHNNYNCLDEAKFINLIKNAFQHKRKNLNNNLLNFDKKLINEILTKYNLSLTSRAEEVPIDVFIEISNAL